MTKTAVRKRKRAAVPAPLDKIRTFSVRLKDSQRRRLKDRASADGLKLQELIESALNLYLAEDTRERKEALNPFGALSGEELRLLLSFLSILRNDQDSDLQMILKAVSRRHSRERRAASSAG